LTSAELYDPDGGSWTPTGNMIEGRYGGTATLLPDGKVLVAGGIDGSGGLTTSAELYDPTTGSWTATASMIEARSGTATLLLNGKVLVAGGGNYRGTLASSNSVSLASAELYDPDSGSWTPTGNMVEARYGNTATLLPDGKVLVAGGSDSSGGPLASAELYDPGSGSWTTAGSMVEARNGHTATLLLDGTVLVAGGYPCSDCSADPLASAELYDPSTGLWTATGSMAEAHNDHTATLLRDGTVLVEGGGYGSVSGNLASAELYDPGSGS
jgi:N-acetylneuraminic acid mutarotase